MQEHTHKLTTASGRPYVENDDTMTVGPHGPILLQDYILHEKMAHFNRERIPERVVHAKGSAAYGTLTITKDVSQYTRAKLFSAVGKKTELLLRFSTVAGERGAADAERDVRGFAIKFYTEEGNWDMVGNNTPVFFVRDPLKFQDFIHSQKRDPATGRRSATCSGISGRSVPSRCIRSPFCSATAGSPRPIVTCTVSRPIPSACGTRGASAS